jgi:hypothetical protein
MLLISFQVFMAVCVQIVVFLVETLCSLIEDTSILEEHCSSIFRVKVIRAKT